MNGLQNLTTQSKLAIYIGEQAYMTINGEDKYNAFLMMVDETVSPVTLYQRLYFNSDLRYKVAPIVSVGLSEKHRHSGLPDETYVCPVMVDQAEKILSWWNDALQYAFYLKHRETDFSVDTEADLEVPNCRAFVKATCKSGDIEILPDMLMGKSGLRCTSIPITSHFSGVANLKTFQQLLEDNERWVKLLGASEFYIGYDPDKRYVGPAPHILKRELVAS